MRNFKNYDFWRDSMDLSVLVYQISNTFPKYEAIVNQMQRAAISIPSNIAEGSSRASLNDFARYLEISMGSAFELETQIELSYRLKYINPDEYNNIIDIIQSIERRLNSFIKKIRSQ